MTRVAISGTGFIGSGLALALSNHSRLSLGPVLTRRPANLVGHPFPGHLCNDLQRFVRDADVVVECSGDVLHATEVVAAALAADKPVVTMNSEFHVTTGSAFHGAGYLTEAEGDQPGCLAALDRRVKSMGFRPIVYGNIKGFLEHKPSRDQMQFWARKQGISLQQVTAFTDGTKVQIEQAFVANALGAGILRDGLAGPVSADLEAAAMALAEQAEDAGRMPVSDYVLNAGGPAGVFIVARHDSAQQRFLKYLKLGDGPFYVLVQPFHLCHLEMATTIEAAINGQPPLMTNGPTPGVGIAAVAKQDMDAGAQIERALGSFECRGEAIAFAAHHDYVPIGLLQAVELTRPVKAGERLRWDQVRLPGSLALDCFRQLLGRVA